MIAGLKLRDFAIHSATVVDATSSVFRSSSALISLASRSSPKTCEITFAHHRMAVPCPRCSNSFHERAAPDIWWDNAEIGHSAAFRFLAFGPHSE